MTKIKINKEIALELLIQMDQYLELLGVELLPAFRDGYFDPDANYTPMEIRMHMMAELLGYDYAKDVRAEAYMRNKKDLAKRAEEEE